MTLSAALIVRDEEDCLGACLASLKGVVDEIVVVDTGSQDRTVAIAAEFTDRIYHFVWIDDFAAARNCSLDHASGDYILVIDADERITNPAEARGRLTDFAERHEDHVVGTVKIASCAGPGPEANVSVLAAQRFFRAGCFRFAGAIHEQLVPVSANAIPGGQHAAPTGVCYTHSGYAHDPASPRHKSHRNKRILEQELAKHPNDEYYLYQLGKAHFGLNEHGAACRAFERALAAIRFEPGKPPLGKTGPVAGGVLTDLIVSLAYAYVNSDHVDKARTLLDTHQALGHAGVHCADFHHVNGYVFLMQGDIARSKEAYVASLRLGPETEQVLGTGSYASLYHLGLLSEAGQDLPTALTSYAQALAGKPDYAPAVARCIDLIVERRIALQPEVWAVCDHEALLAALMARVGSLLEEGKTDQAALVVAGTRGTAPELYGRCVALLKGSVQEGSDDDS